MVARTISFLSLRKTLCGVIKWARYTVEIRENHCASINWSVKMLTMPHLLTIVQVLKDGTSLDSADRTNSASVMQFVRTTLVGMSPSSLRRTYSKRSADFLERSIGSESGLKGGERSSEIRLIEEHIMWLFDHLHIQVHHSVVARSRLCYLGG